MACFDGVDGGHGRQLWLRPAALVRRRCALVSEEISAEFHLAPGQIREQRLEADQRSHRDAVGVQHDWPVPAATILIRGARTGRGPVEQSAQRHVLPERHEPRLRIGAADPIRPDEHRRLVDAAGWGAGIDVDQQIGADAPGQVGQPGGDVRMCGQVHRDAAFAPHRQVDLLTAQAVGQALAGGLAGGRVVDVARLHQRDPHRRTGPGAGASQNHTGPIAISTTGSAIAQGLRSRTATTTAVLTATTRKLTSQTPPSEADASVAGWFHCDAPSTAHGPPSRSHDRTASARTQSDGRTATAASEPRPVSSPASRRCAAQPNGNHNAPRPAASTNSRGRRSATASTG